MNHPAAVIDTNVVVAGLITADAGSPTARILDGMAEEAAALMGVPVETVWIGTSESTSPASRPPTSTGLSGSHG